MAKKKTKKTTKTTKPPQPRRPGALPIYLSIGEPDAPLLYVEIEMGEGFVDLAEALLERWKPTSST